MAPRNARGAATRSAASIAGSAAISRTLVSCRTTPPPKTRTTSRLAWSAERRPSTVPTTVVKKTDRAASAVAVPARVPSSGLPMTMNSTGAMATSGTQ
jgi:hypothetical protein